MPAKNPKLTRQTPRKSSKAAMPVETPKAADEGLKEGANRSGASEPKRAPSERVVTPQAFELARLVRLQSREAEVASALEEDLPEIMQAILDGAKAKGANPSTTSDRAFLFRLMNHPAASAAAREEGARGRPAALRAGLVGRLAGSGRVIEADPLAAGHAAVTSQDGGDRKALPF